MMRTMAGRFPFESAPALVCSRQLATLQAGTPEERTLRCYFTWACQYRDRMLITGHRVAGGGRPPPAPTERDVRIFPDHALRQLVHSFHCYLFKFRFHGQLIFSLSRRP